MIHFLLSFGKNSAPETPPAPCKLVGISKKQKWGIMIFFYKEGELCDPNIWKLYSRACICSIAIGRALDDTFLSCPEICSTLYYGVREV